jgi:hypothetical protein
MEMIMGAKDAVRALLDRLPDDCKLDEVIEQIVMLDGPWLDEANLPPLTQAQRDAIDESIDHLERHPETAAPWREALERMRR